MACGSFSSRGSQHWSSRKQQRCVLLCIAAHELHASGKLEACDVDVQALCCLILQVLSAVPRVQVPHSVPPTAAAGSS
jgi:hypothetical protein